MKRLVLLAVLLPNVALAASAPPVGDEFVGPFASWADLKRDYAAAGDGKADDTAAIQKALDDLRKEKPARPVLYLPAGTYRITRTLELLRQTHNEATGISILGEDPEKTVLKWDGPDGGVMFLYNPWYARIGRLTLDGAGKAGTALRHGERFTTFNEFADMTFRDVGLGIEAGMGNGIAETAVLRCRFLRCSVAGIRIQDWNSLDWWIWQSLFEDCRVGVTNHPGCGHFHVYESLFRRSTEADMTMGNTSYFGIRGNTSVGSRAFFVAGGIGAGAQTAIQGNTILDPGDRAAIRIGNLGPVLLLDNRIRSRADAAKGPVVEFAGHTAAVSVGNQFTVPDAVKPGDRFHAIDDRSVAREAISAAEPALEPAAPNLKRPVIDVPPGAGADAIQKALDEAAAMPGRRPVVHLPAGVYRVNRTLVIPAGADVQLAGDGVLNATSLEWNGQGEGPLLRLDGPSRATFRDLSIGGGKEADGILILKADQTGGRVFGEQLCVHGKAAGLAVEGLARTNVVLHDFGHDSSGVGVRVVGPGDGGDRAAGGRVAIFSGASSNNRLSYAVERGGWLLVRDMWYESGKEPAFMVCGDSGTFTLHGGNIAHPHVAGTPGVLIDGFRGRASFLGCIFTDVSNTPGAVPGLVVRGESPDAKVLALGVNGNGEYFASESAKARAARLLGVRYTKGGGAEPVADIGPWDDAFVREMLDQTRGARPQPLTPAPDAATDVRFFRVIVTGNQGVVVRP